MEVMTHDQQVIKRFLSKRAMLNFIDSLEVDRFQIERITDGWCVVYIVNKSTLTIPKEDYTRVSL